VKKNLANRQSNRAIVSAWSICVVLLGGCHREREGEGAPETRDSAVMVIEPVDAGRPHATDGPQADCDRDFSGREGYECATQDLYCDPCCLPNFMKDSPPTNGRSWCFKCVAWRAQELGLDPLIACDIVAPTGMFPDPSTYRQCLDSYQYPEPCPWRQ
jgi:hypothetical protein